MQNTKSAIDQIVFVLGGARSGKSRYAESMIVSSGLPKLYLATATAGDEEMQRRIADHQSRRGEQWATIEEPLDIASVLGAHAAIDKAILIDCLTLWLTNLMMANRDIGVEVDRLVQTVQSAKGLIVFVSNEVGLGIVPIDAMSRAFVDHAGRLHQDIAAIADQVTMVTAGIPHHLKGGA